MSTTINPDDQVVHTLYGPKTITGLRASSGNPLSGAPDFRRIRPEDGLPSIISANRTDTTRRAARATSSLPYARPKIPPIQVPLLPPIPPMSSPSVFATLDNTLRGCIERFQAEISCIGATWRGTIYRSYQEAQRWKSQCEAAERERDLVKERLRALTLKFNATNSPGPSATAPENQNAKVGHLRSYSSSPPTRRRSATQDPMFKYHPNPRSKSADPSLSSHGADDCFDVTIIGYNAAPSQSGSSIRCPGPHFIRDALNPDASPRLCPRPAGPAEINTHHIDIMYLPRGGQLFCRACCTKNKEPKNHHPVKTFSNDASWDELRNHYITEHPTVCHDISNLSPTEITAIRCGLRAMQSLP